LAKKYDDLTGVDQHTVWSLVETKNFGFAFSRKFHGNFVASREKRSQQATQITTIFVKTFAKFYRETKIFAKKKVLSENYLWYFAVLGETAKNVEIYQNSWKSYLAKRQKFLSFLLFIIWCLWELLDLPKVTGQFWQFFSSTHSND
jgi:hypothetical protein